jgi:hypothetical protein
MNQRMHAPCSGWAAGLAALCLAVLAACGPGVGGTGTGSTALAPFGAQAASVCGSGSGLATVLQCPPGGSATNPVPSSGPARVWWADSDSLWRSSARLDGDQIELTLTCEGLVFTGNWGALPGQAERFYGSVRSLASGRTELASLAVQLSGIGIAVQLNDAGGQPLAALKLLQPVAALPAAGGCTR